MALRHNNNSSEFKKQRLRVLRRDQHTCTYCGAPGATHCDHIVAKVDGGGDEMENLTTSCAACNQRKGRKSVAFFLGSISAPPAFSESFSPITAVTVQTGPCFGQPAQGPTG